MRKIIPLLVILLLLLCGCNNREEEPTVTEPMPEETTAPTISYYEKDSQIEAESGGAVRLYTLPGSGYLWVRVMGNNLLTATDSEVAQLQLIDSNAGTLLATTELDSSMLENSQTFSDGFLSYNKTEKQVVYFDSQLQIVQYVDLPENITTEPIFSPDGAYVYYCVGNEIRSMELVRELDRLIKTQVSDIKELCGIYFNGTVLSYLTEDENGQEHTVYISLENGKTLYTDYSISSIFTGEDIYLVSRMDNTVPQQLVGNLGGEVKSIDLPDPAVVPVLEIDGCIGYELNDGLCLNFYNLRDGKKQATIDLPISAEPKLILADWATGCVWILKDNEGQDSTQLLRWNINASTVQEDMIYTSELFTADNPDLLTLASFNERVEALNKTYGVRIRVWEDALQCTGKYTFTPEHQCVAISAMLDELEAALAEFPKSFVSKSISSKVRICLVRYIDNETKSVQFWNGDDAYIAIASGCDIRSEFMKTFGSVIDSHVLGNSPVYDYWDTLNPPGFVYGAAVNEAYLSGEDRAFVDVESMTSGTADRARVFWQAMQPENAMMFQSETMQKKLQMLCKAIRDAWDLKKSKDILPWEQYLQEPIAYKKK